MVTIRSGQPFQIRLPPGATTRVEAGVTIVTLPDGSASAGDEFTVGDGEGAPVLTLLASDVDAHEVRLAVPGATEEDDPRSVFSVATNSSGLMVRRHGNDGSVTDMITYNATTGAVALPKATTITAGGLTISAGGATVTAGGLTVSAGNVVVSTGRTVLNLPSAADDAAAAALNPAVPVGGLYHTAGAVKQRLA